MTEQHVAGLAEPRAEQSPSFTVAEPQAPGAQAQGGCPHNPSGLATLDIIRQDVGLGEDRGPGN